ncbi:MAG: DUF3365 domain-containing protein [Chlorobi bacterium]|nr:DUF3365 domain-containing protein [Chlorobiota bacterium]
MKKLFITLAVLGIIGIIACESGQDTTNREESKGTTSSQKTSSYNIEDSVKVIGKKAAKATFKALSAEVVRALRDGGPQHAIKYCNARANPLVDSISKSLGVKISRVSHKRRNPANSANAYERSKLIKEYIERLKAGEKPAPVVVNVDSGYIFYAPIVIEKPLCLTCHGVVGRELSPELHEFIKQHYPTDSAYDFRMGDLRGLWKIFVPKEKVS